MTRASIGNIDIPNIFFGSSSSYMLNRDCLAIVMDYEEVTVLFKDHEDAIDLLRCN